MLPVKLAAMLHLDPKRIQTVDYILIFGFSVVTNSKFF